MPRRNGLWSVCLLTFLFVVLPSTKTHASIPEPFSDLSPLLGRDTTILSNDQTRALGPFIEQQRNANGDRFRAIRPFVSISDMSNGQRRIECLWPLLTVRGDAAGYHWSALFAWGHGSTNGSTAQRTTVFPIYFSGTDRHGNDFHAIFPLGGHIRDFLGQDLITFWAFPLYVAFDTGSNHAKSVLWPFIAWSKGAQSERLRIFPFYMRSRHRDWNKRSILWPFWTEAHYTNGPVTGDAFILFPIVGHAKLTDQTTWMFIPPLFRFSHNDAGYRAFNCPWPFIQNQHNPDGTGRFYIWPLWGKKKAGSETSTFFIWPLGSHLTLSHKDQTIERRTFLPVYYSERVTAIVSTNSIPRPPVVPSSYVKVWPLASYYREGDRAQFRILDLWPGKWASPIERNYAPLWTLYRRQWTGTASEHEALWGAVRYRTESNHMTRFSLFPILSIRKDDNDTRRYSFLAGIFQYKREGLQRTYRTLYFFKFKRGQPTPTPDSP